MIEHIEGEEWRDIQGYEEIYKVSNYGRVKSLNYHHTKQQKLLKPGKDTNGYLLVSLCKDGKQKNFRIHRLVAIAFIPIPEHLKDIPTEKLQVNHKDENKENNCVDNLEWCDREYNVNYGTAIYRRVEKCKKIVLQFDLQYNLIKEWESTAECGKNGYFQSNVVNCCNGKIKRYKKSIWKYKNE